MVARASAVDPNTKCPVLKSGEAFRAALGEHEGRSFYRAKLEMKSAAAAAQAQDVSRGFASLASLRWDDDEAVMAVVTGVETTVEGDTCMITWDAPADAVWKVVEKAADAWEQCRREGRRHAGRGAGGCRACGAEGCQGCESGGCPLRGRDAAGEVERPLGDDEF
jgi:hypothetical protein